MAAIGKATVDVVADVSGILAALFGQVERDDLAAMLGTAGLTRGVHALVLADRLLEKYVIVKRKEPDASES